MPDLCIVDLGLPDGDGAGFVADFRAWSTAPVLVLSARSTEHDKIGVLDAAAAAVTGVISDPREVFDM